MGCNISFCLLQTCIELKLSILSAFPIVRSSTYVVCLYPLFLNAILLFCTHMQTLLKFPVKDTSINFNCSKNNSFNITHKLNKYIKYFIYTHALYIVSHAFGQGANTPIKPEWFRQRKSSSYFVLLNALLLFILSSTDDCDIAINFFIEQVLYACAYQNFIKRCFLTKLTQNLSTEIPTNLCTYL